MHNWSAAPSLFILINWWISWGLRCGEDLFKLFKVSDVQASFSHSFLLRIILTGWIIKELMRKQLSNSKALVNIYTNSMSKMILLLFNSQLKFSYELLNILYKASFWLISIHFISYIIKRFVWHTFGVLQFIMKKSQTVQVKSGSLK